MLSGKDAAQRRLARGVSERIERALHPRHHFGGDAEVGPLVFQRGRERAGGSGADHGVRARIRRIRRSLADQRQPVRIGNGVGIAVGVGRADRRHRPPEIVGVLRVVEGDDRVCEREVQQCEEARGLRGGQVMAQGDGLRDLVPVVLDGPVPELAGQRLVRRRGRAPRDAGCLDLVEGVAVRVAGQGGRRPGTELARAPQRERLHVRPVGELGLRREIGRRRLVVAWSGSEDVLDGRVGGTIAGAQGEQPIGSFLPDAYAFGLAGSVGNFSQRLL